MRTGFVAPTCNGPGDDFLRRHFERKYRVTGRRHRTLRGGMDDGEAVAAGSEHCVDLNVGREEPFWLSDGFEHDKTLDVPKFGSTSAMPFAALAA